MQPVFYGNSHFVIPILEFINPQLIITTEVNPLDPVISYANKNNLTFISVKSLNNSDVINKIKSVNAESAVLADFGLIIPDNILKLYPKGIINIHPSLLPKYRGPTPVQSALLKGDLNTGVSLILLDSEVDHGPLITQKPVKLDVKDTADSAYLKLFSEGANLLADCFEKYINGELKPIPQNHNKATYTDKLTRESGFFAYTNPPSSDILDRMINAFHPWPGVWTKLNIYGKLKIVKFLPNNFIQVEGKKPVSIIDFYNGYPDLKETISKIINA